jgi:uncharacterized protein (DUF885 family)
VTATTPASALEQLSDDYWEAWLAVHPTYATAIGDRRFNDRLEDASPSAKAAWRTQLDGFSARLEGLDGDGDPVTRAALNAAIETDRAVLDADLDAFNVDAMDGPHVSLLNVPSFQPAETPDDLHAIAARWRAMPAYLDQAIADLRRGLEDGRVGVAAVCRRVIDQLDEILARPDPEWPLAEPAARHPAIRDELLRIIGSEIRPAFARYRAVVADEVGPNARADDRIGLAHIPGGPETYRRLMRAHTSIDAAPEELHRVGLDEIGRIDAEFVELGARLLGTDGLAATLDALRTDPSLRFATRDEVVAVAEASLARANAAIGEWFGRLPQAPCEVVVMPAHEERHSTIAYYREPAADGSRPGQYFINAYAPETRPRYEAETLAFHESVPGHHLQLAIMQELTDLPAFRRFNGTTSYIEGWGLYTERLSEEMGLLTGEMDRFGVLSFDAWRASRLVVDTGIHALGWTRQQAIGFMAEHTALGLNNVENEVDRYITYAGQALAYKVGQLELLRLRAEARERLGSRFDIRRFHDVVLEQGALPLGVLRSVVERELA